MSKTTIGEEVLDDKKIDGEVGEVLIKEGSIDLESTPVDGPMPELLRSAPKVPSVDDVVEGPVIAFGRARVFVDIHPFGTGIIYGREYLSARETLKNVNIGDTITAKVMGTDNADGYIELSLREARQALIWNEAESAMNKKTMFQLQITDANKGGLIINWNGIHGFLPASQLSHEHYPRV